MGWTFDIIEPEITKIFGGNPYKVTIPESAYPYASINYGKEIHRINKKKIAELFPKDWYIYFHPETIHKDK